MELTTPSADPADRAPLSAPAVIYMDDSCWTLLLLLGVFSPSTSTGGRCGPGSPTVSTRSAQHETLCRVELPLGELGRDRRASAA